MPDNRPEENGPDPQAVDKSEALFSMYLERADDDDNKVTERWKKECDGILIFTGLFSAAVAALLAVSVLDLRPDPRDTSAVYIANMYHLLANATTSQPIILPTPLDPPEFSAPGYAIWVNALWFLSLVMSLTGALLAVLVQQWVHSYLRATQQRQSAQDRVKTREFCAKGLKKSRVSLIVRSVPTLIHVSLFLFFAGLLIWLTNINHLVGWPVVFWLGLCGTGYAYVTIMPILHHDSPYFSPLSSLIRRSKILTHFLFTQLFEAFPNLSSSPLGQWLPGLYGTARDHNRMHLSLSMHEARVEAARSLPPDVNYDAFWWTFQSLKRDSELEQFFDAIPDLCAPQGDALERFIRPKREKLSTALVGLMDRTFSSNLVAESVKLQRIEICMKAAAATKQLLLGHWYFLRRVLLGEWQGFLGSVPFGRFIQKWQNINDSTTNLYIRCVVSAIIATVPTPDGAWPQIVRSHRPWIQLVCDHLNMSESTLHGHLDQMQNVSLANLNCIVSHITRFEPQGVTSSAYDSVLESLKVLESICKLDVQATLPSLQHEFCILWDQLVQNHVTVDQDPNNHRTRELSTRTLDHICGFHEALHGRAGTVILAGASPIQHPHCTENGTRTAHSVPTSHTNNAAPTVNATHPTASHSQHDRLQVTSTTAGPLSSTSPSSHGNRLNLPSRPTSPAPSISNTAIPISASANERTYDVV